MMEWLETFAYKASGWAASPWGTLVAFSLLVGWLVGSIFVGWSEAYSYVEEVITAASFLLLFLLQRSQTKDTLAMQLKLNELLAASRRASSQLINVEQKTEAEILELHEHFHKLRDQGNGPHSIEEVLPEHPPSPP